MWPVEVEVVLAESRTWVSRRIAPGGGGPLERAPVVTWIDPLRNCIAIRYARCMTQLVARIDDDLARSIDRLIAEGVVESRSDAVRKGLQALIESTRRRRTADEIIAGYTQQPQTENEVAWVDQAIVQMIADEPW